MAMRASPSRSRLPSRTSRSSTSASSAPEPVTPWVAAPRSDLNSPEPVGTSTCVFSSPTAVRTPGARSARATVSTGRPAGSVTTWSAVMPARSCLSAAWFWLVFMNTRVEENATASAIGVIAEARRRALARELAAASPAAGPAERSGRPNRPAHSRATSGPSNPTASMKHMTTPRAAPAASSPAELADTPVRTAPPTRATTPRAVRTTPGRSRSTDASDRACPGLILAGRRPAAQPAPSAVSSPMTTAASSGNPETCSSTLCGTAPRSCNCPNHQWASPMPGRQPTIPASGATSSASEATARRICRGVAPMARSRANSRARCPTESATVPAAVKTATIAAMPPKEPPIPKSVTLAYPRPGSSTPPRSSPVLIWTPEPARACRTASARASVSVPCSASTATASTVPGCPASVPARSSANQARGPGSRAVSPGPAWATPATRKSCRPAAVSRTTVSPTAACAARAVPASSTTSPAPGAEPLLSAVPVKACEPHPCAVSTPPGTRRSRAPEPAPSCAVRTGKVKSATAAATPGALAAFAARAASIRAVSGSGVASLSSSSPLPVTTYSFWSAAATTGAFA